MADGSQDLVSVLREHQWSHTATTHCSCGFRSPLAQFAIDAYLAHVARHLERIVAEHRAAALRDAADAIDADDDLTLNHILGGTSYTIYWLRERAAKEADRG